ncbi:hypothetical protein A3B45_03670 [Candidatus Daviesbacteria bacterium RIFCSPLOWO2_01_FULL_39_12]|uniref:Transcriptional repressor PaaX-like central Cas2-like domain-containing protein n=1 Tax=Candidatus Daviesbacteria bacterium RIFCSPLOWO2_01_FULL_39_12 TaxID=1797785 RepID=A0A1F5KUQ4_9BACT|nr:MAG: hypothetical protein A3B45_03670 [Candidatus Daviesbacteria bacterium RIFCSPLOWO2_01_FULL_39_12]
MFTKKSLTNFVLLTLEKSVDGYIRFEHFAYNPHLYAHYGWWDRPLRKSALALTMKRLRENGLVELVDDKELIIRLTDSGRDKAIWTKMRLIDEPWDGKWRIVIWDIPEKRRVARDLLRYKLKWLGFKQLQKSVWITKKNCTQVLRDFIKKMGIKDWVVVIESDNVDF